VAVARVGPRDLAALARCVSALPDFLDRLAKLPNSKEVAPELVAMLPFCKLQEKDLENAILPDPAPHLREGGVIAPGFDAELDPPA